MESCKQNTRFGMELKALIQARSLSMRKLGEQTGIQPATISRIINGKQKAGIRHIELFSKALQVSVDHLLEAAGIIKREITVSGGNDFSDIFSSELFSEELVNYSAIVPKIQQELDRYEQYALTEEGRQLIRNQFIIKTQQVDAMGPYMEQLEELYKQFESTDLEEDNRATIGSVLLYFILSTDVIPDYMFPIGYLDDALAIKIGLNRLQGEKYRADK